MVFGTWDLVCGLSDGWDGVPIWTGWHSELRQQPLPVSSLWHVSPFRAHGTALHGSQATSVLYAGSPHLHGGHTQAAWLPRPVAISALAARACPQHLAAACPPSLPTAFLHTLHTHPHGHLLRERPPPLPPPCSRHCSYSILGALGAHGSGARLPEELRSARTRGPRAVIGHSTC